VKVTYDKESESSQASPGRNVGVAPNRTPPFDKPMTPEEWHKWNKKHAKQHDDLRKAQLKMTERYKHLGVAILATDLTKVLGTLILPEIHTKISENYTEATGVHILAQGRTWQEAFKNIGMEW